MNWNSPDYGASASYSNTARDFTVSGIGYAPYHIEQVMLTAVRHWRNVGPFRKLNLAVLGYCSRDNDDVAHAYYSTAATLSGSASFPNNWAFGGFAKQDWQYDYVLDPPLDSVFYYPSPSYWFWGQTDASRPLTAYLSASYNPKGYNYVRHYFGSGLYLNATLGWRPNPALKFDADINDVVEFDTLQRVAQMNWVIDPAINYAITRDLQIRLSGEAVPAYDFGRINVLLSWNLSPKSWFYVAWNESRTLEPGLPLIERIGVVKLRYLFYF